MKKILLLCLFLMFLTAGMAQAQFEPVEPTAVVYPVTITAAMIDMAPNPAESLVAGDIIAVFDMYDIMDGGDNVCVGTVELVGANPFPVTITTYGTDQGAPGFTAGNHIFYRVFDSSSNRILNATAVQYTQGNGTFGDGVGAELSLTADFERDITDYYNSVRIQAEVFSGIHGYTIGDLNNLAALDPFASDEFDPDLDINKPAPPGNNYIAAYFPHDDWVNPLGTLYMVDVRDATDDLTNLWKAYDFEVVTDVEPYGISLNFEINGGYPPNLGVVLWDELDASYKNLREDPTYNYIAEDGVPRIFSLHLGDGTPPEVAITAPVDNEILVGGEQTLLTWTLSDITSIRYVNVLYSPENGLPGTWELLATLDGYDNGPTSYLWDIPNIYTAFARLAVQAEDWAGNYNADTTAYTFNIAPTQMANTFAQNWHLMSIPLHTPTSDIDMLLGDDIQGPYYVFDYNYVTGYGRTWDIYHGYGYWLALAQQNTVTIDGMPEVDSTRLPLNESWNIVGAALPVVTLPRDSLWFTDGVDYYRFVDAGLQGWITPFLYAYDNLNFSYYQTMELNPWGGYWLQALQQGLFMVTYPPAPAPPGFAGLLPPELDETESWDNWQVQLVATQGTLSDEELPKFGVNAAATEGYDVLYDVPTPPAPPASYVRILFLHPEWHVTAGSNFSQDIRRPLSSVANEMMEWSVTLEASRSGAITLNFLGIDEAIFSLPGYQAWIELNINNAPTINLRNQPSYTFDYPCARQRVSCRIRVANFGEVPNVGVDDKTKEALPTEFSVSNAYPNPFNPSTSVVIAVPYQANIQARVYDLLGRQVANLDPGDLKAGYHKITWNAEGSAGVYFLYVSSEGWSSVQKLVYMK